MQSNKRNRQTFMPEEDLFNTYLMLNAVFVDYGVFTTKHLSETLEVLGYGYKTGAGFTFTTPHIPSRRDLLELLELNGRIPTLKEHTRFKGLGWPYNAFYVLRCLSYLFAGILLLGSFLHVYSDVCTRHPEYKRCQGW